MSRHTSKLKYSAAWLALFAAYLALAIVATYPLTFQATNHVFGLGTPPLNIWALSWVNRQLVQDPLSLFDGNVFFPYPRSLAFSEHLFVPSLLAAPWLAVSNNPVLAHNAVSLISLALAGVGMFLLCRELTGNNAAAFVAGMLYAFHTWNINELIRLQILSNQWFPFLLHALLRFFRHPSPRRGVWVGLTYALQSLSCMYWALYLPAGLSPDDSSSAGPASPALSRKTTPAGGESRLGNPSDSDFLHALFEELQRIRFSPRRNPTRCLSTDISMSYPATCSTPHGWEPPGPMRTQLISWASPLWGLGLSGCSDMRLENRRRAEFVPPAVRFLHCRRFLPESRHRDSPRRTQAGARSLCRVFSMDAGIPKASATRSGSQFC